MAFSRGGDPPAPWRTRAWKRGALSMSARLPLIFAGVMLWSGAACAQAVVTAGLTPMPLPGAMASGNAGALSGVFSIGQGAGPGGVQIAPGPAGAQDGGIQNQTGTAALSVAEGCTIPSPIFNIFASAQFGTTTATSTPLPLTNLSGC